MALQKEKKVGGNKKLVEKGWNDKISKVSYNDAKISFFGQGKK